MEFDGWNVWLNRAEQQALHTDHDAYDPLRLRTLCDQSFESVQFRIDEHLKPADASAQPASGRIFMPFAGLRTAAPSERLQRMNRERDAIIAVQQNLSRIATENN